MTISNLTKMAEKYPKGAENTVGKGEIAHYEQFLLFPLCFQKACFPGASKGVVVWEWVNKRIRFVFEGTENIADDNPFAVKIFCRVENIMGKG